MRRVRRRSRTICSSRIRRFNRVEASPSSQFPGDKLPRMEVLVDIAADAARQDIGERIARSVLDIDHFATALARDLARSKAAVVRELAQALEAQAQALRLAINMELAGPRILGPCEDLQVTANKLRLVCSKTRIPQGSRLALELIIKLLPQLHRDLQNWDNTPAAAVGVVNPQ